MGKKTVRFSDLSGQEFEAGDQPVALRVLEHPDLERGPVQLEALAPEVTAALGAAMAVAVIEVQMPGEDTARRMVLDVKVFNSLAADVPMATLLKDASPVKNGKTTATTGLINYASLERAGTPHRGKVTTEEARLVREHLDQVNARLAAAGHRLVDPTNAEHARRYGLDDTSA